MSQAGTLNASGPSPGGNVQTLTGDTGGPVGADASHNINIKGNPDLLIAGNPGTSTLQGTNLTKVTPYVVGPSGQYVYQTIQSAINAANSAGGGVVVATPGTYTENLTLFNNVHVMGIDFADAGGGVIIVGVHTPPTTGGFIFNNVFLQSATHIFNSNAAGSAHLIIANAAITVTNGYTFNLPNWTGKLEVFDVNDRGSTNDGFVNNSGGSEVAFFDSAVGAGSGNVMTMSGLTSIFGCAIGAPINCITGSNVFLELNVHTNSITFSNNSTGEITLCEIDAPITMNSSGAILIATTIINTSNNPAIAGTGAGTLTLGDINFVSGKNIANTVTIAYSTAVESGTGYFQNLSFDRGTTTLSNDGQLWIGKTGSNPVANTLTAGRNISIANTPGNITISQTAGGMQLIQTQTANNSTSLIFSSGITGFYNNYCLIGNNITVQTNTAALSFLISTDGVTFITSNYQSAVYGGAYNGTWVNLFNTTASALLLTNMSNASSPTSSFTVNIYNANSTTNCSWSGHGVENLSSPNTNIVTIGGTLTSLTNTVKAIKILMSGGNITTGTFSLYGISS